MNRLHLLAVALFGVAVNGLATPLAYITNQADHSVSVVDLATARVTATIPVARSPAGVVAVSQAGKVFVTAPDSNAVSVIEMASASVVATLAAGQGAVGIDAWSRSRRS